MVGRGRFSTGSFSTSFSCGRLALAGAPPCTETNDGQKPFRQEKSLLQLLWSIVRLRPSSVSSGLTDTQLLLSEQSPQPSHTASLMKTRLAGSGKVPRLRRRAFSAARGWARTPTGWPALPPTPAPPAP